jgi:isopenicillin N synthase-like dioxygenase
MTASIDTVSFAKLAGQDSNSIDLLLNSFLLQGFCYLDLQGHSVIEDVQAAFQIGTEFFSMPQEDKLEYDIDRSGDHKLNG